MTSDFLGGNICIQGIGDMGVSEFEGDILLAKNHKSTVLLSETTNFRRKPRSLSVSLDFALRHPYCDIEGAMDFGRFLLFSDSCWAQKIARIFP
jgi:hypothetical protein